MLGLLKEFHSSSLVVLPSTCRGAVLSSFCREAQRGQVVCWRSRSACSLFPVRAFPQRMGQPATRRDLVESCGVSSKIGDQKQWFTSLAVLAPSILAGPIGQCGKVTVCPFLRLGMPALWALEADRKWHKESYRHRPGGKQDPSSRQGWAAGQEPSTCFCFSWVPLPLAKKLPTAAATAAVWPF